MAEASVELLWLVGAPIPERAEVSAVREVRVHTPDAGRASFRITLDPTGLLDGEPVSDHESLQVGSRMVLGVVFGIVPHSLVDGRVTSVGLSGPDWCIEGTDLLADLDERHTQMVGPLDAQVRMVLHAWDLPGVKADSLVPSEIGSVACLPGESDGAWLTRAAAAHGLVVSRKAGPMALSNIVRVGPLAMERTAMPPITPGACLQERRFTPVPGVRVAELRLHASTALRGVLRGVHTLQGFGEDDGSWYAQDIIHHLGPGHYEQTLTLVRLPG